MPGAAKLQDSTSALYLTLQPETYRKCSSTGDGYTYDENGSLTENAKGERFTYDMEQHQTEFYGENNSSEDPDAIYYYDGEGRRVKKVAGSEVTLFVYDASGTLVAEYSTQLAGTQQVSYLTQDHLGSPRVITNENGTVTGRKDYSAFGEELIADSHRSVNDEYTGPELRKGYTGYEKDDESKLEFAQARYYNSVQGRFTTVDPLTASASVRDPQTFNRYSYVLNSPYKFTDPLGLKISNSDGCGFRCRVTNYINGTSETLSDADRHLLSAHLELGTALGYSFLNAASAEQRRQASSQQSETTPTQETFWDKLWRNHNGREKTYVDKDGKGPEHQCAINMSAALQMAGVDMSSYTGSVVTQEIGGIKMRLATDVSELSAWVRGKIQSTLGDVAEENPNWKRDLTGRNDAILSAIAGRRGILIAEDSWFNKETKQIRGHIDLWDGSANGGRGVMKREGSQESLFLPTPSQNSRRAICTLETA